MSNVWDLVWEPGTHVLPDDCRRVMVTGHRPKDIPAAVQPWCKEQLNVLISDLDVDAAVSGMALGADTWWVESALQANVPFVAAIPCPGQPDRWPTAQQTYWAELVEQAAVRVLVSDHYHRGVFHERNKWMVRNSDHVVAVWTGKTSGGTFHAVSEARKLHLPLTIVDPLKQTVVNESSARLF